MIRRCVLGGLVMAAFLSVAATGRAEGPSSDAVVMTLAKGGLEASKVDFTILHVDRGPHGFEVDLDGVVKASLTCDDRDLGLVAAFPGAKTFRARITRGTTTRTITGIKRNLILPDFDTLHAGAREAITFRVVQGLERADAFSVVIEHDDQRIVLTPEGPLPRTTLPATLTVSSSGLDGFTLAGARFEPAQLASSRSVARP
jgi:hypothetical protein